MEYLTPAPRGAELLDQERPGWALETDAAVLSTASPADCPLGQLYGDYSTGLRALFGTSAWKSPHYGFDIFTLEACVTPAYSYADLNREWRALIAERTTDSTEGTQ